MPRDQALLIPETIAPPRPPAGARGPLRLLTFSSLYPNPAHPHHGVFVENRLRHLVASGEAVSTVLAPVPWFPGRGGRVAVREDRHGITVHHPRFLAPPGLGMYIGPFALHSAARATVAQLLEEGARFDAIDAHYLYPDGVAAVRLGREFGLPVVITARGSDTSQLPRYALPRRLIEGAMRDAAALIAVSAGLKEGLVALGAPPEKVTVLRNGVDLDTFRPLAIRKPSAAPVLLSVGHLIPRKGHDLVIGAIAALPDHRLIIVGEGPDRGALEALARRIGVADRVSFAGAQPHANLPEFYAAADVMILASSREGWANVLLEAMACGTPVIASPAWGSREAVAAPEAGLVLDETTPGSIALAVRHLLAAPPSRAATRAYAERFSWDETTAGQLALFRGLVR
ncbi:glycosyltransferase family 4 protein [Roseococcus sp.]|uniref:glycosyltransferase family 4 protein n=1 Tax=Roseococcus sp. TaxID=2109646 RepID=UPI003BAC233E